MTITIRRALDEELENTVRLRWIWNIVERGRSSEFSEVDYVAQAAEWARAHAVTHLPHVAVDVDGRIVGMAWLALAPRVASTDSLNRISGDLQSCYVLPEFRGSGVGGRLVDAVLDTARALNVEHVTVHTTPDSIGMYTRHGFTGHAQLLLAELYLKTVSTPS